MIYEKERNAQEVVLCYDSAEEVVLTYRQETPLPEGSDCRRQESEEAARRKKHRRQGMIVFLLLFAALVTMAVVLSQYGKTVTPGSSSGGSYRSDGTTEESATAECTIPRYEGTETAEMTLQPVGGTYLTPQQVYQLVNPAVVTVMGYSTEGQSVGTGILFSENGFLLTNAHVIEGRDAAMIVLTTGESYEARMVGYDYDVDLAVLKIEGEGFPCAVFGDSDGLYVGEPAYAIGNPLGVELRGTFTSGVISGLGRKIAVGGTSLRLLQTDAALNNGNSGGPLINQFGQVIGINTAKMRSRYANVEGLGLAIPTADALDKVNALIRYGEIPPTPSVGVTVAPLESFTEDGHLGLDVWEVVAGGAGDLAGIQVGDVLLRADGQELLENQDLLDARDLHAVGEEMILDACRGGEHFTVTLTLQSSK